MGRRVAVMLYKMSWQSMSTVLFQSSFLLPDVDLLAIEVPVTLCIKLHGSVPVPACRLLA